MIDWSQKSRPKKIPRACSKTQKNRLRATDFVALKLPERGYTKTQRKTLEIEHSCLFIHHTIWIYPFPHLILFNTRKKSLLKSSYPSQIFVPKKIPQSKISDAKKSFDHPRHLKSRVPPLGLPALAGHPIYHVNVIKLKWEIIWTCGLPHLPGVPHLHVNRPLIYVPKPA